MFMQETVKKGRQKDSTMLHFGALFCVETYRLQFLLTYTV